MTLAANTSAEATAQGKRLVLIIDDDGIDRRRVIRWLGREYPICEAATARVGLDMARRLRPGCVLLDYRLTDANGLAVLEELTRADLSVVLLTGQGDEAVAVKALKGGAVDYLVKDAVTREELEAAVERALSRGASRQSLDEMPPEIAGFEDLARELLHPAVDDARAACVRASDATNEAERTRALGTVRSRLAEIDEHVAGLTAFARVEGMCRDMRTVDLAEIAAGVVARLADSPWSREVELHVEALPIVHGAEQGLGSVLHGLIGCALRNAASAPRGEVRVSASLTGSAWSIRIEDNGEPPRDVELSREVFLPYRRGTGRDLAFALAAQIIRRHAGDLWIEPNRPTGCKVTFSVSIKR